MIKSRYLRPIAWIAVVATIFGLLFVKVIPFLAVFSIETREVRRVSDPSDTVEAILITKDTGATSSTAYHVVIAQKLEFWVPSQTVLIADKIVDPSRVRLTLSSDTLTVRVPYHARIFRKIDTVQMGDKRLISPSEASSVSEGGGHGRWKVHFDLSFDGSNLARVGVLIPAAVRARVEFFGMIR